MELRKLIGYFCFFAFILFIGKSDVYGLTCNNAGNNIFEFKCDNAGSDGCTKSDLENALEEKGKEIACFYENSYLNSNGELKNVYTYIYYDRKDSETAAGIPQCEPRNIFNVSTTLEKSDTALNFSLELNNKCPSSSHIIFYEDDPRPFVCLDNGDGSCKSGVAYEKVSDGKISDDRWNNIIFKVTDSANDYLNKNGFCVYYLPYSSTDNTTVVYSLEKGIIFLPLMNITVEQGEQGHFTGLFTYSLKIDDSSSSCPNNFYYYEWDAAFNFGDVYSYETRLFADTLISRDKLEGLKLKKTFDLVNKNYKLKDPDDVDCEIFDDNLREIINGVMDIIRIAIPLLLIGLIGVDFGKAIFASDDKAISKAKKNAITRIIIAIVIYFVPTLINLVFNIANDVWADTHYEICVLGESNNNN